MYGDRQIEVEIRRNPNGKVRRNPDREGLWVRVLYPLLEDLAYLIERMAEISNKYEGGSCTVTVSGSGFGKRAILHTNMRGASEIIEEIRRQEEVERKRWSGKYGYRL